MHIWLFTLSLPLPSPFPCLLSPLCCSISATAYCWPCWPARCSSTSAALGSWLWCCSSSSLSSCWWSGLRWPCLTTQTCWSLPTHCGSPAWHTHRITQTITLTLFKFTKCATITWFILVLVVENFLSQVKSYFLICSHLFSQANTTCQWFLTTVSCILLCFRWYKERLCLAAMFDFLFSFFQTCSQWNCRTVVRKVIWLNECVLWSETVIHDYFFFLFPQPG